MRGILFDLDGTLLDLDLGAFLSRYFAALRVAAEELPYPADVEIMDAIMESTQAMMAEHVGSTNRDVFYAHLLALTGIDLNDSWSVFERFYAEEFPGLGSDLKAHAGARKAVEAALDLGLEVAVATNPIFPRVAIDHRLRWAGLGDLPITVVTSYENMHACKPYPAYFLETASMLGVSPRECMMVGDDRSLDMPAADVGMRTFYVGPLKDAPCDYRGTMTDLAQLLPRLVDRAG